jgi:hypothetical protein
MNVSVSTYVSNPMEVCVTLKLNLGHATLHLGIIYNI